MSRPGRLLSLAARNLGRQRRRTVVSGATLVAGVVSLMLLQGLSQGFVHFLTSFLVRAKVGAVQVHRTGYLSSGQASLLERAMDDTPALRRSLAAVPGVSAVTGRLAFTGLISNGRGQAAFVGQGLEPEQELAVCPRAFDDVVAGQRGLAEGGVLLGEKLARGLKAGPGKTVTLSAQSEAGRGNAIQAEVIGAVLPSMPLDAQRVATVPLAMAQALTGMEGRVTEYALGIDRLEEAPQVAEAVRAALGPSYEVHGWGERVAFFKEGVGYVQAMVGFVALLLLLVVVAGITNAQLMSVFERQREIGTALAVGMRRADVRTLFLLEALLLGTVAAAVGTLLGWALVGLLAQVGIPMSAFGFAGGGVLRMQVDWGSTRLVVAGTLGAAVGAGLLPAVRASRLSPIAALRGR